VRRPLAWLAVAPFVAGGVLASHALAYQLTGTPTGAEHDYLQHAPEILSVAVLVAVSAVALVQRMGRPSAWPVPVAAVLAFVLQEHLEHVAHTGHVPWLLTTPVFVIGILLQSPVALLSWFLAGRLLRAAVDVVRSRRPRLPRVLSGALRTRQLKVRGAEVPVPWARGPPILLSF
jgi:hypothetical protein